MNRRTALAVTTVALSGAALSVGAAMAQQRSLKDQLVGTWRLVSTETASPSGAKRQFYGANPRGIIIFDAAGRYAAVQGRPDRPKVGSASRFDVTTEALGMAAKEFAANFGTWSVIEADKTLTRRFEGALIPHNEGAESKDSISLAGDELTLTTVNALPSGDKSVTVYRRAR